MPVSSEENELKALLEQLNQEKASRQRLIAWNKTRIAEYQGKTTPSSAARQVQLEINVKGWKKEIQDYELQIIKLDKDLVDTTVALQRLGVASSEPIPPRKVHSTVPSGTRSNAASDANTPHRSTSDATPTTPTLSSTPSSSSDHDTATPTSPAAAERDQDLDPVRMYESSMKEGCAELQTADSVIVGVAGSGKTCSLAMALDEEIPKDRVSTPCAKAPVRTVARTRIGVQEEKLSRTEGMHYFNSVMQTARMVARGLSSPSCSPPLARKKHTTPNYMRKLEEEMIQSLRAETQACNLYGVRWNNLTDSGGQPQFLELLPIFIHHISLGIFTIKLNERLDHHPMIEYYGEDGKPVGNSYRSYLSNEQIIRYCMRALISQGSGRKNLKFLFLGTHLDLEESSVGESIEDKNSKLRKIVRLFKMKDNVIYSDQGGKNLIFAINAKTPGPEDWEVMKHVKKAIVESSNVPSIPVPIRWFAMELALLRFVKETKQAVLPKDTCYDMVAHLHFDRANFEEALKYLHQIKLIFYFEKGRLVVADIQMILNKLSEVVRYNIKLVTNPSEHAAMDSMWVKFCRHGILHIKCLDIFPDHYIEGVFSPKELLQLFVYLCIVSQLSPGEFLMPCLLPAEEEAHCRPNFEIPALAVEFPNGGPMLGSYCRLVCYLISTKSWELAVNEEGEPLHLTRSSIRFSAPEGLPGDVIIYDPLSSFFMIAFDGPLDVAREVCPLARETILTGLQEVSKSLSYLPPDEAIAASCANKPEITFVCSCGSVPLHPASISTNGQYLRCLSSKKFEKVTANHKIWFGGTLPSGPVSSAVTPPPRPAPNLEITLKSLTVLRWKDQRGGKQKFSLRNKVSAKWARFGTLLDLESNLLDGWNKQSLGDAGECWDHVMQQWLDGGSKDYEPSWDGLCDLLEDADYAQVAHELQEAVKKSSDS